MRIHSYALTASIVLTGCFLLVPLAALSEDSKNFEIVKIKDFLEDSAEFDWNITASNGVKFNNNNADYGLDRITNGNLRGYFTRTGEYIDDGRIGKKTYEINPYPYISYKISEIRGSYFITLPNLKRIQLELNYDLFGNEKTQGNLGEYFIEIFENNIINPLEWVKTGEIHQIDETYLFTDLKFGEGGKEARSRSG